MYLLLSLVVYLQNLIHVNMIETQFPKFKWGMVSEQNSGHTKDEWGTKEQKAKTRRIIAYTVSWDNPDDPLLDN